MNYKKSRNSNINKPRYNEELFREDTKLMRGGNKQVRVIYEKDGENHNELMLLYDAKKLSDELELDLIEISQGEIPVLKIYDYSKYLYELKKQNKQKNKKHGELKEIQLTVNISQHDLEIKANKAKEFIEKGDKVKVVLSMKPREFMRHDESEKSLYQFLILVEEFATPETLPKTEGRKSIAILKRKKSKQ